MNNETVIDRFESKYAKINKNYIVPSKGGFIFIGNTGIITLTGLIYSNNLILVLGFILFSVLTIVVLYTNFNISKIEVKSIDLGEQFAQGPIRVNMAANNSTNLTRQFLNYKIVLDNGVEISGEIDKIDGYFDGNFDINLSPLDRGRYTIKKSILSTRFPLGLFYSWSLVEAPKEIIVWPTPKGQSLLETFQRTRDSDYEKHQLRIVGLGEYKGHRRYQQGDSLKMVDWKAHARGNPLLLKTFEQNQDIQLFFSIEHLVHLSIEEKLSQLSKWVIDANKSNIDWELDLKNTKIGPKKGHNFMKECLNALADYKP